MLILLFRLILRLSLKIALIIFVVLYLIMGFLVPTILIWRKEGINPIVLTSDDTPNGYIGRIFKIIVSSVIINIGLYIGWDKWLENSIQIFDSLQFTFLSSLGLLLISSAFILIVVAQSNMFSSWRVGIDQKNKTQLIKSGLFRYSRNPIFLGLLITLLGLLLIIPNVIMLILLIVAYISIQIQVRLEEEFLMKSHSIEYSNYKTKVRRWI